MIHLGDITKIHDAPFVHCVTFGSPCQDLSIAGKRAGLAGERSGLFIEAVRIIKEMREQSGRVYPAFAVWENVPGAFSSNKGEDFRTVLEELARIEEPEVSIPRPEGGKWAKAGYIAGNGWSIAWRTFDAQFWGVPQRRRRIAVVLDLGGQRAGEMLFERTGMSGNPEPCIPPWKGVARNPAHRTAGYDRVVEGAGLNGYKSVSGSIQFEKGTAATIEANMPGADCGSNRSPTVLCKAQANTNAETYENLSPTLTTCHDGPPIVFESHSQDARHTQQGDTSSACTAQSGTGGNNMPLVVRKILLWIVRRLTPTECERLQGFPDGWTDIGEWIDSKGKRHKTADSPRYKALGNSIALPQWWWITCKMARYLPEHATLGSLFDGIGGFPLVWETRHGKGTAVWASEIEEFPIAVTKERFSCSRTSAGEIRTITKERKSAFAHGAAACSPMPHGRCWRKDWRTTPMTDLERRALLGDRQAQEECTRQGILLPCPMCNEKADEGRQTDVDGYYWWPTIYCGCCGLHLTGVELWGEATEEMRSKWNTRPAPPVGRCGECAEYDGMDCMAWPSMSENDGCTCFKPKGGK